MLQHTVPESRGFGTAEVLSYGRCHDFVWLVETRTIHDVAKKIYTNSIKNVDDFAPCDHISLELLRKCKMSGQVDSLYRLIPFPRTSYMVDMRNISYPNNYRYHYFPNLRHFIMGERVIRHYAKNAYSVHTPDIHDRLGPANFQAVMKVVELDGRRYVPLCGAHVDAESLQACREFETRVGWKR